MFDFVRTHSRWLQLILLVLILPSFVALGVQGYSSFSDGVGLKVATVDGHKITQGDWDNAAREQAERMRRESPQMDPKLLDNPEARQQALEGLVSRRALEAAVNKQQLVAADGRVASVFRRSQAYAFLRTPEGQPNKALLAAQGMSSEGFAERLRQDLGLQQVLAPADMLPRTLKLGGKLAFDALLQQRDISVKRLEAQAYRDQVQLSDADVATYYQLPATQKRWMQPERAQIEYLVLDAEALKQRMQINEGELKTYYEQNRKRFSTPEERRVSHILIKLEEGAKAEQEAAARAQLEALQAQLRADPKQFAALARKHSQDEISAAAGGELDFIARDFNVKAIADAAFSLAKGEISPIVRSEFGLHLVTVNEIRGGDVRSFEDVRAELESEQRSELAKREFQALSEQFSNAVYEQADALQPVAEKFNLELRKADLGRTPVAGTQGPLASPKLIEAVFAPESLKSKRNTEAIETGAQQLVSARVLKHVPAAPPALDEVKDAVREQLLIERAAALAKKAGEAMLAQKAEELSYDATVTVSRMSSQGLPREALIKILQAPAANLAKPFGVDLGTGGYLLVRLNGVKPPSEQEVPAKQAEQQYAQALANAEGLAYLEALKAGYKAKILISPSKAASTP